MDVLTPETIAAARTLAEESDCDVLMYNGPIDRGADECLIDMCGERVERRRNVTLVLVTSGGDAHAAYRLARCLQTYYEQFTVIISGWCKSAGTLITLGADEIVFGPHGELGPLDVQMKKEDDIWKVSSGLTVTEALDDLEFRAFKMLSEHSEQIVGDSLGQITFRTAADIVGDLIGRLLAPIYQQIDPMHIGEAARATKIAVDYAERLVRADTVDPYKLAGLIVNYSSHGFVIDEREARTYFKNVRRPTDIEIELIDSLGRAARLERRPHSFPSIQFLTDAEEADDGTEEDLAPEVEQTDGDADHGEAIPRGDGSPVTPNPRDVKVSGPGPSS